MRSLLLIPLLGGCAVAGLDVDTQDSSVVLGTRDLLPVAQNGGNVPARYRGLYDAIGRMMPMQCTVSHVGNGIAITAGHCFGKTPRSRQTNIPCITQSGNEATVEWGVRGDEFAQGYMVSRCTKILALEYHDQQTDYAIIQLSPAPNAAVPLSLARPPQDRALTIFSHPHGRPLEWSQLCARGTQVTASVFRHDCDTEPGSSGAAVYDDPNLRVIGIHNGGHAGEYNYATYLADTPLGDILAGNVPPEDPPPEDPTPTPEDPNDPVSNDQPMMVGPQTIQQGQWADFGPYHLASPAYLRVEMTGTGNADLYMRKNEVADGQHYDCHGGGNTSTESCWVYGTGPIFISVYAFTSATISLELR
jgi:V8-like Glu-specific endopeptidase